MIRTSALTATALAAMLAAGVASAQTTAPAPSAAPPPASTQAAPPPSQPSTAAPSPSASTQTGAPSQSLSPDTIQSAQQALQQNGFYKSGKIDGKMGPKTREAIRSFQHAKGLQASGHLNPKTLSALGVSS